MKFRKGSLTLSSWQGIPIRINWTVILGALFFSRFQFLPIFWVAFFGLVLIHEAGHTIILKHYRLWVDEIVIHGFGGYCRWNGEVTAVQRALIAWGGVIAQLFAFAIAAVVFYFVDYSSSPMTYQLYHVFIRTNILIIIFNLIPIEPLDGAKAWKIIDPLWEKIKDTIKDIKYKRQDKKVRKELQRIMNIEVEPDAMNDKKISE